MSASPLTPQEFRWRAATAVLIALALVAVAAVAWYTRGALLVGFAGILLGIGFDGAGNGVARLTGLPRRTAIVVALLIIAGLLAGIAWLLEPGVMAQFMEIQRTLPASVHVLQQTPWVQRMAALLPGGIGFLPDVIPFERIAAFFTATYTVIFQAGLALFIGVALALEPDTYVEGFLALLAPRRRQRAREVMEALHQTLRRWLVGQLVSMVVVGALLFVGLSLAGVPLALALSVIAAFLEFVPTLGPILSAIPALLLALLQGPWTLLLAAGLLAGVHVVESYLLVPMVHRFTVAIPPVLAVVAFVLAGMLFGPLGLLLAMPLTATAMVLVRLLYVEDIRHDRMTLRSRDTP